MALGLSKLYFLMSFRFDKKGPSDFGLTPVPQRDDLFIRTRDNSLWKGKPLYDFGWGNETGFVRQPELGFDDLWQLLLNSPLEMDRPLHENAYGAAHELLDRFPDELLDRVEHLFAQHHGTRLDEKLRLVLLNMGVDTPVNRSNTIGKSPEQIRADYERWKGLSQKVVELGKSKP